MLLDKQKNISDRYLTLSPYLVRVCRIGFRTGFIFHMNTENTVVIFFDYRIRVNTCRTKEMAGVKVHHYCRRYSQERIMFGKPIAGFQLIQRQLVEMMVAVNEGMLVALHIGRMKDRGPIDPAHISFGKFDNVRRALEVARTARSVLGANGITLDYPAIRHMNNLESVYTYEGTNEVHTLIMGQAITGISAFE